MATPHAHSICSEIWLKSRSDCWRERARQGLIGLLELMRMTQLSMRASACLMHGDTVLSLQTRRRYPRLRRTEHTSSVCPGEGFGEYEESATRARGCRVSHG